jgi:ATP-dependent protease ClpP protease subunit
VGKASVVVALAQVMASRQRARVPVELAKRLMMGITIANMVSGALCINAPEEKLSGEVTTSTVDFVMSRLLVLESLAPRAEIRHFSGAVYPGLAIYYGAMQLVEALITTFGIGAVFCTAALLLTAGEPERRGHRAEVNWASK